MAKPLIGEVIRCYREAHGIGLRDCASSIGISHSTLSRIERGLDYDSKTLLMVQRWLFGNGD